MPATSAKAAASSDLEPTIVAERLRLVTTRLARLLRQQAGSDLTPTMLSTLSTVHREGPLTLGALAAHEQVAPPTITKTLGRLDQLGLIERTVDPDDRRVCRVRLSTVGRRFVERTRNRRRAWLTTRLATLEADEVATLAAALPVLERLTAAP
ncbi:MAG: MarR family transcriptional regulator [Actinomycetota bacterium]|nr:MarR family transcriptional regulator [Actinomycetota bacterium]